MCPRERPSVIFLQRWDRQIYVDLQKSDETAFPCLHRRQSEQDCRQQLPAVEPLWLVAPAQTIAPGPTISPDRMIAPAPIDAPSSMVVSRYFFGYF